MQKRGTRSSLDLPLLKNFKSASNLCQAVHGYIQISQPPQNQAFIQLLGVGNQERNIVFNSAAKAGNVQDYIHGWIEIICCIFKTKRKCEFFYLGRLLRDGTSKVAHRPSVQSQSPFKQRIHGLNHSIRTIKNATTSAFLCAWRTSFENQKQTSSQAHSTRDQKTWQAAAVAGRESSPERHQQGPN